uniref:Uncharacterized protein n=1 Tax=Cacopsylla melanoneura TaxID=428564 RepID=A0A8D8VU83_9HEMI
MVHFLQQCLRMVCPLCQVLPINHKAQVLLVTQCSLWFQVNKDPPLLQQDSLLNLPKQTPSLNPPLSQLLYHTTTNLQPQHSYFSSVSLCHLVPKFVIWE